jgi:DnaJ family protein B protein 4
MGIFKNYYRALGLDMLASFFDIRRAYRQLALKYHPDKSQTSATEENFKEINEAYKVLSDEQKREKYNKTFKSSGFDKEKFIKDPPVFHEIPITFEQINVGVVKKFKITKNIYDSRGNCKQKQTDIILDIKRGMKAGTKFPFRKEGDQRPQHIAADIIFVLVEKPHPHFTRNGNDLLIEMFHSFDQLNAGKLIISVPLLSRKKLHINLRNRTLQGLNKFKSSGNGLPDIDGTYGDLLVHIKIDLPAHIKAINT